MREKILYGMTSDENVLEVKLMNSNLSSFV